MFDIENQLYIKKIKEHIFAEIEHSKDNIKRENERIQELKRLQNLNVSITSLIPLINKTKKIEIDYNLHSDNFDVLTGINKTPHDKLEEFSASKLYTLQYTPAREVTFNFCIQTNSLPTDMPLQFTHLIFNHLSSL